MVDHNAAWEPVTPEPCNCDQSLALARRLEVYETALRGIRESSGSSDGNREASVRLSWVAAIVKLADYQLLELNK
jgi:hypothetical protein